ncbi:MAG: RNA polymerase sigma factor [Verrucomicrobiota bacterium]|jgi:RNA polymerase sigma-70 factor, ECF subfamily
MTRAPDFEGLVECHYAALYRFAFSLARDEAEACDLTQETFYIWATKGHQLRDFSKAKTWLFTTLHRRFLEKRRKTMRFEHVELGAAANELPRTSTDAGRSIDTATVLAALDRIDEPFRAAIALCYLEDFSYQQIADVLEIPLGTVKSRISRGIGQLQAMLLSEPESPAPRARSGK